ncbi:MAG: type III pantothenate kinase [Prevotellaceae bacterium]|jgi:type III pantothenate kinase|nr:type III pantothenate kinase [Prevotellaceae bacterium]
MNLIIDQGNSFTKIGIFLDKELIFTDIFKQLEVENLESLFGTYPVSAVILSSVVNPEKSVIEYLRKKTKKFILLDEHTPLPIENLYKTPETLGKDRIAACVGAHFFKPNADLLVIDAGTAVTYDVVNAQNQYIGGNISPGLEMRRKALHTFTQKLPLIEMKDAVPMLGATTEEAILAGIVNGLTYEMEGYISALSAAYPGLSVFLTGGDAFYFEKKIKSSTFASQNLLLVGLNRILNFRCQKKA